MTHYETILTTLPYQLITSTALSHCWRYDMRAWACTRRVVVQYSISKYRPSRSMGGDSRQHVQTCCTI